MSVYLIPPRGNTKEDRRGEGLDIALTMGVEIIVGWREEIRDRFRSEANSEAEEHERIYEGVLEHEGKWEIREVCIILSYSSFQKASHAGD